ncbi:mycofactocin system FadH/OYE family oxidoreductase 1 [Klenkia brasiliensis]|uniref:2,4-dienoyl-CoA reductase (NADPH2) n=1 Tax=Klenkia brasiliensis TaxID=333142 RepID=A0A1G7PIA6_9ACTN|nr:mycofactocin system FadH/OYE family oxidoreductase 1 [Klenkia brasiliensis]SDF85824.1 2,4-dienoyl-CoA reductase (NADPH2) [Klenkia brasiliensis]
MRLTGPWELAGRTAPSRALFGPHETNLGTGRGIAGRHVAYYARRAAGGTGVLVTEAASVHPSDHPYERAPLAADCAAGWAAVGDACRPHGTVVLAGLTHTGGQGSASWTQAPPWGPSRVPDVVTGLVPVPLGDAEVAALVAGFAGAAATAVAAGLDGVEVDAGPRALLRQFLSPLTNTRDDGYGTDRVRLLREVLAAVRAAQGPDRVLALRLCVDEQAPWAGLTPEGAAPLVAELAPLVDLLTLVRGSALDGEAYRPTAHRSPGFHVELLAAAGGTPVVAQGSVVDPDSAEELLAAGYAAVELTRAQIADAGFVAAVRAGRSPRPCLLCNQACLVLDTRNPPVSCVVDPRSGHETTEPDVEVPDVEVPGAGGRPVVVAGAGPAGLEAARVLALRGHDVEVVAPAVGGLLPVVAAAPGRDRFHVLAAWLVAECTRLGVRFTAGTVQDADVVATGGQPGAVVVPGAVAAADVLAGAPLPAGPVLVHDPVGGPVGVGVAELLAAGGREVVLATPDDVVGSRLGPTGDLVGANRRLARAGVRRMTAVRLVAWDGTEAVLQPVLAAPFPAAAGEPPPHAAAPSVQEGIPCPGGVRIPCAAVVDAGHRLPGRTLPDTGRVRFAGDVVAPRTVLDAVLEGRRAALAVVP